MPPDLADAPPPPDHGAARIARVLAIAGGAVLWLFETAGRVYALHGSLIVGVFGLAGGAIALGLAIVRKPAAAVLALLAAMVAVDWRSSCACCRTSNGISRCRP